MKKKKKTLALDFYKGFYTQTSTVWVIMEEADWIVTVLERHKIRITAQTSQEEMEKVNGRLKTNGAAGSKSLATEW